MASYGYTFQSGDGVTPTRLNDARTVSDIVNADIKSDAAIAGTKIAPDFGSQNISTSGNIGVGTGTPTGKLGISVSTGRSIGSAWDDKSVLIGSPGSVSGNLGLSFDTTNGATIESAAPGVATYPMRVVGSQVQFFTANTERMRITDVGNVGIGILTPDVPLHVNGNSKYNGQIDFLFGGTSSSAWVGITSVGMSGPYLHIGGYDQSGVRRLSLAANETYVVGNVGIGTSSPSSRLHVEGDLTISSATTSPGAGAVAGYLVVNINGTSRKIPFHAT